jgi:hypothetical protein
MQSDALGGAPVNQAGDPLSPGLLCVLICGALVLLGGAAHAQEDDILWADAGKTVARFISGPALASVAAGSGAERTQATQLSVHDASVAKMGLESLLERSEEALAAHPELGVPCLPHLGDIRVVDGPPPRPASLSLADLVRRAEITVVGTVERLVAGLDLGTQEVATHEFLRVTDVVRDTTRTIQRGQAVSLLKRGGTLSYAGRRLCTDSGGEHVPVAGERLLLIGVRGYGEPNPRELTALQLFVVENGAVIPDAKAYPYLKDAAAKSISALRAELGASAEAHE